MQREEGMRIGIDARLIYYSRAGIGQYILGLLGGLAALDPPEEFFILKSRKDKTNITLGKNFLCHSLWTPSHHRLEQWTLPLETAPLRLDLLHSPDFIPPFRTRSKSVITIHDLAFLLYPHLLTSQSAHYYAHVDEAVKRADHIIAVSETTKGDAVRLLGVPQGKITVIYEAVNPLYRPLEDKALIQEVTKKYHIPGSFILFVSTIEPRKNVPTLLRAYRRLLDAYKAKEKLVVVGERGWLYEETFTLTEQLHLSQEVLYLGHVPVEDLVLLYNAASVHVHPAIYEGFGLPPLEAMACGTPTIVANVSSLPEIVGDAAVLVDPLDEQGWTVAMWKVLTEETLRKQLKEKGLTRAALFSWERAAQETLRVYRGLGSPATC